MVSLKKVLGIAGVKQENTLPPLVLSESLCIALEVLSQIFGMSWHMFVVSELRRTMNAPTRPSGQILAGILIKLLEEASISRPGTSSRFVISNTQIVYRSADRRYVVLIVQGEGDSVRVVWQVSVRQAGTTYIAYKVVGKTWQVVDWKVASQSLLNPELLAKAGGEVLGFLEEHNLRPPNSPFQKALDAQIMATSSFRERAKEQ